MAHIGHNSKGTYIAYRAKRFSEDRAKMIDAVNTVIGEYEAQGFTLTVRQIYYQFVQRGWIENKPKSYDIIQDVISDGRLAGLISWTAIEDRERSLKGIHTLVSPVQALEQASKGYARDLWVNQPWRPEVWVEKKALEGVIGSICNRLRVDFFACKGYNSQSEQWVAGQRFAGCIRNGQRPIVFHLGDHDPSGLDMTRDNRERLEMFAGVPITVTRIALNMPQIEELRPPPNPAKMSDSRAAEYVAQYGESSWELDALDPAYIHRLIEKNVAMVRDPARWDAQLQREVDDKMMLRSMIEEMGGSGG